MPVSDPWDRAASWLAAWDSQGNHRTATDGDNAGAEWLAAEAAALGADVAIEEFAVERLDPGTAFLDIDGARIPAIPAFDAPSTMATASRAGSGQSAAMPRSPSPSCRRNPYIAANTNGCGAAAAIAALSSCVPGRARACHC